MPHIAGANIRGSHTTVTEKAKPIASYLYRLSGVAGLKLGAIDNGGGTSSSNTRRVKIIDEKHTVKVSVSGNSSDQFLRVFLRDESDRQEVKLELAQFARNQNYDIKFHDLRCSA